MKHIKNRKRLAINLISMMIAYVVSLGISFFLTPYLTAYIGKETYSFYSISTSITQYVFIIANVLNGMAARFITIEIALHANDNANDLFKSVLISNVVLAAVLAVPMLCMAVFAEFIFMIPAGEIFNVKLLFALTFIAALIRILTAVYGVATIAKDRVDLRAYQEIGVSAIKALAYVGLFRLFKPEIYIIGIIAVIEAVFNLIVQLVFTRILLPQTGIRHGVFRGNLVKTILLSSVWNSLINLGDAMLSGIAVLLANILVSSSAGGDLSVAHVLIGVISGIITALVSVFIPRLLQAYSAGEKETIVSELLLSQRVVGVITDTAVAGTIVLGKTFYSLWMPTIDCSVLYLYSLIQLIPVAVVGNVWTINCMNMVTNHLRVPAKLMLLLGVANIMLGSSGVILFHGGVIWIISISALLNVVYCLIFVPNYIAKYMDIKSSLFYDNIVKSLLTIGLCCAIGFVFNCIIKITTWSHFIISAMVLGCLFLLLALLALIPKTEQKKLLSLICRKS